MNKGALIALVAAGPVVGIALIVVVVFTVIVGGGSEDDTADCGSLSGSAVTVSSGTLPASVGPYSGAQLTNAAQILTIGAQRGLDQHAQETALIAAMTESTLQNLTGGDRDSVGLFQMRPSQGWGTVAQIEDTSYAINLFYTRLVAVPGWESKDADTDAQAVEVSAFPDRYATHEADAIQIMNALSGVTVSTVSDTKSGQTCGTGASGSRSVQLASGTTVTGPHAAQIDTVIAYAEAQLGDEYVLGGAGPSVWDCSGLTMKAYAAAGIDIDDVHSATVQWQNGVKSGHMHPLSQVQPGDLIFWGGDDAYHVAISLGGNQMIAATKPGDVVKIETIWGTPNAEVWRPVDALG